MTKKKEGKKQTEPQETKQPDTQQNSSANDEKVETKAVDVQQLEEYQQLDDKYLRLAAEFENYKKRNAREFVRLVETAENDLILKLLDVIDDFHRALSQNSGDINTFKTGIRMISDKLVEMLQQRGLEEIKVAGEFFDPVYHDAVMQKEVDDEDDGIVLEEIQKGYFFNKKVLRPAKVIVAKNVKQSETSSGKHDDDKDTADDKK